MVLRETARALNRGGKLLIIDMLQHEREEYRQQMGHVWLGFEADMLNQWLKDAGFLQVRVQPLPVDHEAKGPSLFAATARK